MSYVARLSERGRRLAAERASGGRGGLVVNAAIAVGGLVVAGLVLAGPIAARWRDDGSARPGVLAASGALAAAAQDRLDGRAEPAGLDAAERLALASLRRSPLNAPALRVLGEVAKARGDPGRAQALFQAAARWSRRDTVTNASLLDEALRRGDVVEVMRRADIILRYAPEVSSAVFPPLAQMAADPRFQPALARQLATRPAWRPAFLTYLGQKAAPGVAVEVMARMADDKAPPTDAEVTPLLSRMVDQQRYLDAFVAWQQFLPATAGRMRGNVRDGDFDGVAGAPPFGWDLRDSSGATAQIQQGPSAGSAGSALKVSYDGVSTAAPARQLLVLGQGAYRLTVRTYVSAPRTSTHLAWTVTCAEDARPLGATPDIPLEPGWNVVTADFQVPAGDCDGQWLTLQAVPGERTDDVELWFDGVDIRRLAPPLG
ncbi:MAG: hypothetical protein JSR86_07505 [Proteobacteria bacterium]|nr:hypothetical protein [Pseudomonadota bacterium]